MEELFEFILELIFDVSVEASKNKKVPKPIRYLLVGFIILFFIFVIGLISFTGILMLKDAVIVGILLIVFGMLMLFMSIMKFRKIYLTKCKKE